MLGVLVAACTATIGYASWRTVSSFDKASSNLQQAAVAWQSVTGGDVIQKHDRVFDSPGLSTGPGGRFQATYVNESDKSVYLLGFDLGLQQGRLPDDLYQAAVNEAKKRCSVRVLSSSGQRVVTTTLGCHTAVAVAPDAVVTIQTSFDFDPVERSCIKTHQHFVTVDLTPTTVPTQSDSSNVSSGVLCD